MLKVVIKHLKRERDVEVCVATIMEEDRTSSQYYFLFYNPQERGFYRVQAPPGQENISPQRTGLFIFSRLFIKDVFCVGHPTET